MSIQSLNSFALHDVAVLGEDARKPGFRDVTTEHTAVPCMTVEGSIPEWLKGTLYRQSGGAFVDDGEKAFLDGLAHLSAFHICDGEVTYSNKFMRSKEFKEFMETGRRTWAITATSSRRDDGWLALAWAKLKEMLPSGQKRINALYSGVNPNVNTFLLSDSTEPSQLRLAASTESNGDVCEFNPQTLDTISTTKTMPVSEGMVVTNAAHWFFDPSTCGGFHVSLNMKFAMAGIKPRFTFSYALWHGSTPPYRQVASHQITSFKYGEFKGLPDKERAAYMHSMAQTENYVVLLLSSKRVSYGKLLSRDFSQGFFGLFESVETPLEFMVYRITKRDPVEVEYVNTFSCQPTEKFMPWHLANSYEDAQGRIVIDTSVNEALQKPTNAAMEMDEKHFMARFYINLETSNVEFARLDSLAKTELEFPNINPLFHMKPHHHIYAVEYPLVPGSGIVHIQSERPDQAPTRLEGVSAREIAGEPVFVPRPGGIDELDGVVLVEVLDTEANESHLLICEVSHQRFAIQAKIKSPIPGNLGLHSTWVDHASVSLTSKF